ncbi:unknown [Prevotella sp. CAG:1320]|nr:unknown [Prevotella sp. CAG:1320]
MLMRKVFSFIKSLAEERTHCPLIFNMERLLYRLIMGIPKPALTDISFGPSIPLTL